MASDATSNRLWLAGYAIAYLVLGCLLAVAVRQRMARGIRVDEPVRVIHVQQTVATREADGRLDINAAAWHDLDRLPGIGEQLARRIVEHREAHERAWRQARDGQDSADPRPAFLQPADLLAVKGIGPKVLANIRPHLRFPGDPPPDAVPAGTASAEEQDSPAPANRP